MGFETGAGEFMQDSNAGSYTAAQMRRSVFAWAARTSANTPGLISGGLLSSADMQLSNASSGLVVNTSVGECLIPGSEATSQGGYHGFLSSTNSTTLATANGSNPRIDLICATVDDPQYTPPSGGTSGFVTIQGVTGTPTSGATLSNLSGAPSRPLSSLLLGYVLVPAAASNLTSGDIKNVATQLQLQPIIPGQLLAPPTIYTGTHTYTLGGSLAALDTTNLTTEPFVAPASGAVTVWLAAAQTIAASTTASWGLFLHDTTTLAGPAMLLFETPDLAMNVQSALPIEVTDLTPGTTYQFDWAAVSAGGAVGFTTGPGGGGPSNVNNPATMKVFSA